MTDLAAVVEGLRAGKLAVIPTDTVYGIAALPSSSEAVASVYDVKGRARSKGLPVLAASSDDLRSIAVFDDRVDALAKAFWPGSLTLVLPRADGFEADLGGDGQSVAVRVPGHELVRELLSETGALAVTSANVSGAWAATSIAEARAAVGHAIDLFLDGGRCDGTASSIVSLLAAEPELLRKGPITMEEIQTALRGDDGPPKERVQLF